MGWQWHQLDRMQIICISLQTDNHARTSPLKFMQAKCMFFVTPNQQHQSTAKAVSVSRRPWKLTHRPRAVSCTIWEAPSWQVLGTGSPAPLLVITHSDNNDDKPVGFYGPIAPPGPKAPCSECPPNVVPNSEFQTCPDPEFPNVLHSEFMNTPSVEFLNVPVCSVPMSYFAANGVIRCATGMPQCIGDCSEHAVLVAGA